jgi:D-xylose transport system substrate-binding protein
MAVVWRSAQQEGESMTHPRAGGLTARLAVLSAMALALSACAGTSTPTATPTIPPTIPPTVAPTATPMPSATPMASATPTASPSGSPGGLSVDSFDISFSAMSQLTDMVNSGSGLVGVLLPDTTSSTRYVSFDAPYLQQALQAAGYSSSDFKIDNAQGVDATELSQAQADITAGAKVLIMDPIDSTVGQQIQSAAAAAGVTLISYDRATFAGTNTYYVSFNNVNVGKLIGQGLMQCVSDWGVTNPMVFELDGGEDTDPNAIDFAKGYNSVIWGQEATPLNPGVTNSAGYTLVGDQIAPGWNNAQGGTIFQQQFTAHPEINATVEANDGLANAVIGVLKSSGVPAKTIPTTGQDATLQGMEWILQNYQCGSVYKPIYKEAQAAVALATYLRAGQTPPASLVNGTTTDPSDSTVTEPAVLLTPTWVNTTNMNDTVIKDQFVSASDLCTAVGQDVCSAAGITP